MPGRGGSRPIGGSVRVRSRRARQCPTRSPSPLETPAGRAPHRDGSSTTRRWTACARMSAASPSSARRARPRPRLDEPELPGVTGSERLVGGFPADHPAPRGPRPIACFASNVHRSAAMTSPFRSTQGRRRRPLDAENMNTRAPLLLRRARETRIRRTSSTIQAARGTDLCKPQPGYRCLATRIAYTTPVGVRRAGHTVILSARPFRGRLRVTTHPQLASPGPVLTRNAPCLCRPRPQELRTIWARPAKEVMPVPASSACWPPMDASRGGGVPASSIVLTANGTVVELTKDGPGSSTRSSRRPFVTAGRRGRQDVALRDRDPVLGPVPAHRRDHRRSNGQPPRCLADRERAHRTGPIARGMRSMRTVPRDLSA